MLSVKSVINHPTFAPTIGTIEKCHITDKGENHYRITWAIPSYAAYVSSGDVKSPTFTIPNRDKCVWYLKLQSIYDKTDANTLVNTLRLVLDRKSDCKAALATFKLSFLGFDSNKQPKRTFKFSTKSDNSDGILYSFSKKNVLDYFFSFLLTIQCELMIETISFEDNTFSNDFGSLENRLPTDVVLAVGEKKFPAHKTVLIARSSVFAAMFAHNMTEAKGVVNIDDMDEDVVEEMLRYIYTGEAEKLTDMAKELLIAAEKYDLKGLRNKCEEILTKSLSSANAFELLSFADLYNANNLKFETINFITIRSKRLVKSAAWESLWKCNPEIIREIAEVLLQPKFTTAQSE